MKKEYTKCNICNIDKSRLLFNKDAFKVVKCRKCGLVYVNPRLNYALLKDMYNDNKISPFDYYLLNRKNDEKTFDIRLKAIEKYKKSGKLLDIGCGIGVLLNQAKKRGWDAYGLDVKKDSVSYAKKNFGVMASVGTLENHKFQKNFFDVIIMNDFLEHVPNPLQSLREAHRLLKSKGLLFIATPNIESTLAKISGKLWLHIKPDEHIYYFSPKTLKVLLKKADFKMLKYKSFGRVRDLDVILKKMQTYTKILYKAASVFGMNKILSRFPIYVNLGDEMGIFAKK